jgi:hypothetical protein
MNRILTTATALALCAPVAAHAEKFMIRKSQFMKFIRTTDSALTRSVPVHPKLKCAR